MSGASDWFWLSLLAALLWNASAQVVVTDSGVCGLVPSRDGAGSALCYPSTPPLALLPPGPPTIEDRLVALASSRSRLCALTAESTILCAFGGEEGGFDPQARAVSISPYSRSYTFLHVAMSDRFVCGVVAKPGTTEVPPVLCYTLGADEQAGDIQEFAPPFPLGEAVGSYFGIAVGDDFVCALDDVNTLVCHTLLLDAAGRIRGAHPWTVPAGVFTAVSARSQLLCALSKTYRISCWAHRQDEQYRIERMRASGLFDGIYEEISVGSNITCAKPLLSEELHCDLAIPAYEELEDKAVVRDFAAGTDFVCFSQITFPFVMCYGATADVLGSGRNATAPLESSLSYDRVSVTAGRICASRAGQSIDCADTATGRFVVPALSRDRMLSRRTLFRPGKMFIGKRLACGIEAGTLSLLCDPPDGIPGLQSLVRVETWDLSIDFYQDRVYGCVLSYWDAELACFGHRESSTALFPAPGTWFDAVSVSALGGCALDLYEFKAACWTLQGEEHRLSAHFLDYLADSYVLQLQPVAAGDTLIVCVLDLWDDVICFQGADEHLRFGPYDSFAATRSFACGIVSNWGYVECWSLTSPANSTFTPLELYFAEEFGIVVYSLAADASSPDESICAYVSHPTPSSFPGSSYTGVLCWNSTRLLLEYRVQSTLAHRGIVLIDSRGGQSGGDTGPAIGRCSNTNIPSWSCPSLEEALQMNDRPNIDFVVRAGDVQTLTQTVSLRHNTYIMSSTPATAASFDLVPPSAPDALLNHTQAFILNRVALVALAGVNIRKGDASAPVTRGTLFTSDASQLYLHGVTIDCWYDVCTGVEATSSYVSAGELDFSARMSLDARFYFTASRGVLLLAGCSFHDVASSGSVIRQEHIKAKVLIEHTRFRNLVTSNPYASAIVAFGQTEVKSSEFVNCSTTHRLGKGGAITCLMNFATITTSTFRGCSAKDTGGAVWMSQGYLILLGSDFAENTATQGGGAIWIGDSQMSVVSTRFRNHAGPGAGNVILLVNTEADVVLGHFSDNRQVLGSAVEAQGTSRLTLRLCDFLNNTADGGVVLLKSGTTMHSVEQCIFERNRGVSLVASPLVATELMSVSITASGFVDNQDKDRSGAVYAERTQLGISRSFFQSNSAGGDGGAIGVVSSSLAIVESLFSGNGAHGSGGAIFALSSELRLESSACDRNTAGRKGGAVYAEPAGQLPPGSEQSVFIASTSFTNNRAALTGGALQLDGMEQTWLVQLHIANNSAVFGGGLTMRFPLTNVRVSWRNLTLTGNHADEAGGAIFILDPVVSRTVDVICSFVIPGSNTAGKWGPDVATTPKHLAMQTASGLPVSSSTFSVRSGDVVPEGTFRAQAFDGCENAITFWPDTFFDDTSVPLVSFGTTPGVAVMGLGARIPLGQQGLAAFGDVNIYGTPGQNTTGIYVCFVEKDGFFQACSQFSLYVTACQPGQRITTRGNLTLCEACPSAMFSSMANQEHCVPCLDTENIVCSEGRWRNVANVWVYDPLDGGDVFALDCPPGLCEPDRKCGYGRKPYESNPLCGECLDDYYESLWSNVCVYCPETNVGMAIALLLYTAAFVFVQHKLSQASSGPNKVHAYFIAMNIMVLGEFSSWVSYLGFLGGGSKVPGGADVCIFPWGPYQRLAWTVLHPFLLAGFLLLQACVHWVVVYGISPKIRSLRGLPPSQGLVLFPSSSYLRTFCWILLLSYSVVAETVFAFLDCRQVGPFEVVWSTPAVHCDEKWDRWAVLAIVVLVLYILLGPFYLFFGLFWANRRGRLFKATASSPTSSSPVGFEGEGDHSSREARLGSVATPPEEGVVSPVVHQVQFNPFFQRKFGVFYEQYRVDTYWYEAVAISRRTIAAAVWRLADPEERYAIITLLNLFWCVLHLWIKPFREESVNTAESISLVLTVGVGIVATAFNRYDEFPAGAQAVLFVIFVVPGALYFLYMILMVLKQKAAPLTRVVSRLRQSLAVELAPVASFVRGNSRAPSVMTRAFPAEATLAEVAVEIPEEGKQTQEGERETEAEAAPVPEYEETPVERKSKSRRKTKAEAFAEVEAEGDESLPPPPAPEETEQRKKKRKKSRSRKELQETADELADAAASSAGAGDAEE